MQIHKHQWYSFINNMFIQDIITSSKQIATLVLNVGLWYLYKMDRLHFSTVILKCRVFFMSLEFGSF